MAGSPYPEDLSVWNPDQENGKESRGHKSPGFHLHVFFTGIFSEFPGEWSWLARGFWDRQFLRGTLEFVISRPGQAHMEIAHYLFYLLF